jgi:L-threonylcarbamoyladenylate synthase
LAVEAAVAAVRAGELVVLPTDTVYGLCADARNEEAVGRIAELKGRPGGMPIALLAAELDAVLVSVPEVEPWAAVARELLPGPYTLVLPNPAERLPWLAGANSYSLGIRIPKLPEPARAVLGQVGIVAATSANLHGQPDPGSLEDVPEEIVDAVAALVDAGELPGSPSTVVDLTGPQPRVLREGAVPAAEALAAIARAATE